MMRSGKPIFGITVAASLCAAAALPVLAAEPGTADVAGVRTMMAPLVDVAPLADIVDPMVQTNAKYICGGQVSAGTPIAGDYDGADGLLLTGDDGTSGVIPLAGIPDGAKIRKAVLFWSVLTDSPEVDDIGMHILFDGMPVAGTKVGFVAGATPCFPQDNTVGWKADVTAMVSGNGNYVVAGFPGANSLSGPDFTEGATLAVLFDDGSRTLKRLVEYEGVAVTNGAALTQTLTQTLAGFTAGPFPVTATWYPVIGNGQNAPDYLWFGSLDLGSTILNGSTAAFGASTCSYTDSGSLECFWDDDNVDVSAAFLGGDTSVTVAGGVGPGASDCHSWIAMQLVVGVDPAQFDGLCTAGGAYVDAQCPIGDYRNHGDYMSCVSQAAQAFLSAEGVLCGEAQSCIVNPRARSNVGKKPRP